MPSDSDGWLGSGVLVMGTLSPKNKQEHRSKFQFNHNSCGDFVMILEQIKNATLSDSDGQLGKDNTIHILITLLTAYCTLL